MRVEGCPLVAFRDGMSDCRRAFQYPKEVEAFGIVVVLLVDGGASRSFGFRFAWIRVND